MNVTGAISLQIAFSQVAKTFLETPKSDKVEIPGVDEKRAMLAIDILMRRSEQKGITSEDVDALDAFLEANNLTPDDFGVGMQLKRTKGYFLLGKEIQAGIALREMEDLYANFKQNLQSQWSGLAHLATGFTVSEDGQLKVTSPPNTLTARDEEILTALLNETKGLQPLTLKHAKLVIEMVQLDKPQFEGKVTLDLSNFHKLIDYGLLLNKGALDLSSSDSWLDQLHKKSETDPDQKRQRLHIEV
ncbi:hypothetical protein [Pseudomonas vancouverensis]|uniref:Uncharacterized protein n=1 Tax=Pseudomonas vancouverensis TaxID=95300 RepID=A0A1H2NQ33_PSEVA|nr:hypothetical protein [Pseudomonas vancouverensis]KAB0491261.1 hypothetical protein F7R09_26545 [Pseudomonas vancouverensis]TDB64294.1 hypothetical protein EIY72_11760 [Pseudomonas vancouverensis]SDV07523.1 hypothetical protein SAMN05216558_2732 [Pseudomonas vancouverensis]